MSIFVTQNIGDIDISTICPTHIGLFHYRVTSCLENLEMSGNLTAVREMSGILLKIRELSGKNLVREKLPKTVHCKLHICVHTGSYSRSLLCLKC